MVHVQANVAGQRSVEGSYGGAARGTGFLITRLRGRALLALLRTASWATSVIPRHEVGEPLSRILGLLWYVAAPAARAAVRDNLRHVLGREPSAREVLEVFYNGVLNYWDTFVVTHLSRDEVVGLVDIHGLEHLEAARSQGHGVIAVSPHLGSVAFVGQFLPALGYPTVGLLEPVQSSVVYQFFARQRQALGVRLLPASTSALKELLLALRRNEFVGLVADRDITDSGPVIPFFDAPTHFPDGAASLSVRTGAPILSTIAVRRRDGHFDLLIDPLPDVPRTGDAKADVLALTRAVAKRLEYHIGSHPEQWTVFQRRWPDAHQG